MFIFLSKLLPLFVYPVGLVCILILGVFIFWKKQKFAKILLLLAFLVIFIGGNRYLATFLAKSLEWKYQTFSGSSKVDLIVVLGGATEPMIDPRPMTEVNAAGDRVLYAAKLFREYPQSKILLSGGDIEFLDQSSSTPAADMADLLEQMDVPQSAILLQDKSQNTYEDALYSCKMIKAGNFQNVLLVTSAFHMPRSMKLFEKQGCKVIAAPTDYSITQTSWEKTWHPSWEEFIINLVPSYSNLSSITKSLKEYLGMFVYHFRGWI